METINKPYVKQYDEKGNVLPLVNGVYLNQAPNRRERMTFKRNKSFTGNHKGISLTVSGKFKYERVTQIIKDQFGRVLKTINHYLAK